MQRDLPITLFLTSAAPLPGHTFHRFHRVVGQTATYMCSCDPVVCLGHGCSTTRPVLNLVRAGLRAPVYDQIGWHGRGEPKLAESPQSPHSVDGGPFNAAEAHRPKDSFYGLVSTIRASGLWNCPWIRSEERFVHCCNATLMQTPECHFLSKLHWLPARRVSVLTTSCRLGSQHVCTCAAICPVCVLHMRDIGRPPPTDNSALMPLPPLPHALPPSPTLSTSHPEGCPL